MKAGKGSVHHEEGLFSPYVVLGSVLALPSVTLALMEPRFLTVSNLVNILRQSSILGIVALGMTCVILVRG